MKIKVSETTPIQLDWLVAKCEGCIYGVPGTVYEFQPSSHWSQGGPIIEREGIEVMCNHPALPEIKDSAWHKWDGFACSWRTRSKHLHGSTPLIAAMRCYISSRMGDEVEVPEELML